MDGQCAARSRDKDGDGHRGAACKAIDGTIITTGDDCDDGDKDAFPGAWDGPADATHPDRCDGKDQSCDGTADETKTPDGKSCLCNPGDTLVCGEDGGGKTIPFPMLDANGKPVGKCKLGKKTCGSDGKWGACVGAVPPDKLDICNGDVDDDCDGKADLADETAPPNLVTWSFDGDGDGYVDKTDPTAKTQACDDKAPTTCPKSMPGCDLTHWKLGNLPAKDCNDHDGDVNPAGVELCDGVDNDCNGTIDDDYANNAPLWYFDWDGDNYGDINTTPKKSCNPPTTFPAGCTDLAANVPGDYCTGVAGEGNPPSCPVPACDVGMWKKNIPNTDCKDRPDQALTGVAKGNDPKLVYPGATDLCNDRDYNCDGSVTTGCGCSPVGAEKPCGSSQTCNLANQKCVQGGTWDTSACLPDKARVDYCPDDDVDGYCDLTKCVTDACPGDQPADGHKYKERTACLGFATPNLGGTDCSDDPAVDADAKNINPGVAAEVCNGDGKDHNCNGKANTPGAGDCDCVNGGPVACAAPGHAFPVAAPPDTYPYASDPALQGICIWDHKSCINGKWTACTGGTGAYVDGSGQLSELCNGDGLDHDCDGATNKAAGECSCQPGQQQDCGYTGAEVGICKRGKKDCIGGTYANSPCLGAVYPTTRDCASSVDNNCDGSADNLVDGTYCGCLYGTVGAACGTHPEDGVGTCKAGKRDCSYDAGTKKTSWGSCTGSVGPNPNGEGCGPQASDVGCDGKKGNGPGCVKQMYILYDTAQVDTFGPKSFLLSNSQTEAYYTGTFRIFMYAKQPAGTQGTHWEHFLRCVRPTSGKWQHSMGVNVCPTSFNYEGLEGWLLMGVPSTPPTYNPVSFWYNSLARAWIPFGTSGSGAPADYVSNQLLFDVGKLADWPSATLQTSPYFAPGSLNP